MITITCHDCCLTVESGGPLVAYLSEHGFEIGQSTPEREPQQAFRLEAQGSYFDLYLQDVPIAQEQSGALIAEILAARIHDLVSRERKESTFVRGEVVEWDGRGWFLAGSDLSGQSRLARALESSGANVWSRHFAVLNSAGEFLPYPQPNVPSRVIKPHCLTLVDYLPTDRFQVEVVSVGVASLLLSPLVRGGEKALEVGLSRLARVCQASVIRMRGSRGEAEEAALKLHQAARAFDQSTAFKRSGGPR